VLIPSSRRWARSGLLAAVIFGCCVGLSSAATVPAPIVSAVHGRVVGWAKSGSDWFVVYLTGEGERPSGACGLTGASWQIALVQTVHAPVSVVAKRQIGGAMCGNWLPWVRTGRFSDGRHREVAFTLWTTPSIGAWTYIFRLDNGRISLLARLPGDRVVLKRGTVTVIYENRGRSPHGELRDVYRFSNGRYHLVSRH